MIKILQAREATSASGEKVQITQQDLHDIADNYSVEEPAPFVIGHPKTNGPAKGWVEKLVVKGDSLYAKGKDWASDLVKSVKDKEFIKISASLHKKDSTANPNPGFLSLRHVRFLGDTAPAMPMGTVDVSDLSDGEDADDLIYSFSDFDEDQLNFNNEDNIMPDEPNKLSALQDQIAALKAEKEGLQDKVDSLEKREGIRAAKDFSDSISDFATEAVKKGNILPAQKDELVKLFDFANDAAQSMDFSEEGAVDPVEALKSFVSNLKSVDFNEGTPEDADQPADFSVQIVSPDGHNVSKEDQARLKLVEDYAQKNEISFDAAIVQLEERGEI